MARTIGNVVDDLAALAYRGFSVTGKVPPVILKRLGIPNARQRPELATLFEAVRQVQVRGTILECGVYRGASLLALAHLMLPLRPAIYGLDSFEGLDVPSEADKFADGTLDPAAYRGAMADVNLEILRNRLRALGWDHVKLVKGYFQDTLPSLANERFSLVHIDCDVYEAHVECLEFVYPRMLPGGWIVLDDYGNPRWPGAKRAVDEFLQNRPEKPEKLPGDTERAWVVKFK